MKPTPASGTASHAKPLIRALEPGQSVVIELPERKFWAQGAAGAVRGVAKNLFGDGGYETSVVQVPRSIAVRRV